MNTSEIFAIILGVICIAFFGSMLYVIIKNDWPESEKTTHKS